MVNRGSRPSGYVVDVVFETTDGSANLSGARALIEPLQPGSRKRVEAVSVDPEADDRRFRCRVVAVDPSAPLEGDAPLFADTSLIGGPDIDDETFVRCRVDTRVLTTAVAAYFEENGRYTDSIDELVMAGKLADGAFLHGIELLPAGGEIPYAIVVVDPLCGTPGHRVGHTPNDL